MKKYWWGQKLPYNKPQFLKQRLIHSVNYVTPFIQTPT